MYQKFNNNNNKQSDQSIKNDAVTKKNNNKRKSAQQKNITNIDEFRLSIGEVCRKHVTNLKMGLDEEEAVRRLARDGPNTFTPPPKRAWYWIFIGELTSGFALLLWFAAIGSFISFAFDHYGKYGLQDVYLGVILVFTILLTGGFSFYQQTSSSKVFRSFRNMTPQVN